MKEKLLKFSLYFLFVLSIVSLFYYFFGSKMPDNYFTISSKSSDFYSVVYYLSSFLAQVAYFVGPWVVAPFLCYAFVYNFILSSRDITSDGFIPAVFSCFFFGLTFLLLPAGIGEGLRIVVERNADVYTIFFTTIIFGFLVFYLTLRAAFFRILKLVRFKLEAFGRMIFNTLGKGIQGQKKAYLGYKNSVQKSEIKKSALGLFKESKSKLGNISAFGKSSLKNNSESNLDQKLLEVEENEVLTPIISNKPVLDGKVEDEAIEKNRSNHLKDNLAADENLNQKARVVRKDVTENKFFKSSDLINCISENISHVESSGPDNEYFERIIQAIEDKLGEFKLDAKIINILKGPVVDTFELELGSGVKVSKVTGLSDDIGLALNGAPIRIVYPMRGKSTIGVEVPRNPRDFIYLDEVLSSDAFNDSNLRLPVAMGKDAFGDVKVVDLAGMPHMLVAGATGAGKSVFINTLLVSLIIKKSPRQLKLVLIDPKQLELAIFQDLPHLMLPVITDPTSSSIALLWAVQEMDRRYSILKELGVKNIEGFNKKIKSCDQSLLWKINQFYEDTQDEGYELPYIVVVIDEFADLILSKAGKEIELNVNRLAAKARAAGIHLVVATQRPSTDVVTGVVKANFPTRVAFRVSTGHDSKTILDQYGAQKLLGKGDMLYKHGVDLVRMHSSFVDEVEIEGLLEKLATIPKSYNTGALDFLENGGEEIEEPLDAGKQNYKSGTSDDPIYQQALEIVFEQGSASASMIQRRLRVGYNRAANLVEEMEKNGVVGPAQGSKPRKVLARPE